MSYLRKDSVIIELGQFYTKVGMGYENSPHKLIRTMEHFIYECIQVDNEVNF